MGPWKDKGMGMGVMAVEERRVMRLIALYREGRLQGDPREESGLRDTIQARLHPYYRAHKRTRSGKLVLF